MEERRLSKRTDLIMELLIKQMGDAAEAHKKVTVELLDVSKGGIGFECAEELQLNEMYECNLTIWTKEVIHAFVRIVRIEKGKDMCKYGAIFIGMTEMDLARIETYQTVSENAK
jgi:hypothetical protein